MLHELKNPPGNPSIEADALAAMRLELMAGVEELSLEGTRDKLLRPTKALEIVSENCLS